MAFTSFPVIRSGSSSGQVVTVETAMATVPIYAAVSLIAGAIGSLPLKVYRDQGEETVREEARSSKQWKLLHDMPNPETSADEFWEMVTASLLLWGNAFIWKERDRFDTVSALWVINPSRVRVAREALSDGSSRRVFWLDGNAGFGTEQDILHIRGLGSDGLVGYSPIQQARNRLGVEMAREEFSGSFWRNGTFAGAVLEHPKTLSETAIERLRTQIREKSGTLRAGEALILEEDMKWKELGMPLEDAQFVEQANLGRLEIAILYGLPPYKLGASFETRSLTYANAEWEGLDFVKWCLRRWLVRIENSLRRDAGIFPAPGRQLYPEFLVDALLRADTKSRYEAYKLGIDGGWLTPEWIIETENLDITPDELEAAKPEPPQIVAPPPAPNGNGTGTPPPAPVGSTAGRGGRAASEFVDLIRESPGARS